ncbi:hypothetical protein B0H10DRAFT_1906815 [Mycena sp. CBHHK59/15]|nr:hypothetical protein B0H10DRAFT_1906815 [Mycena sp. CBHHK59/15]
MKVILTGTTGFIGSEVLAQCRQNPAITSIIALSRRPLAADITADPKVQTVLMKDFKKYPDALVQQLAGADACIWCMGTTAAIPELEIDYPLAFVRAFAPTISARQSPTPFRYLHLSGALVEQDQAKPLWFLSQRRKTKGRAESALLAFAQEAAHNGRWETNIVKPEMVMQKTGDVFKRSLSAVGVFDSVVVGELAAAMIDIVRRGSEEKVTLNAELVRRGRAVLEGE